MARRPRVTRTQQAVCAVVVTFAASVVAAWIENRYPDSVVTKSIAQLVGAVAAGLAPFFPEITTAVLVAGSGIAILIVALFLTIFAPVGGLLLYCIWGSRRVGFIVLLSGVAGAVWIVFTHRPPTLVISLCVAVTLVVILVGLFSVIAIAPLLWALNSREGSYEIGRALGDPLFVRVDDEETDSSDVAEAAAGEQAEIVRRGVERRSRHEEAKRALIARKRRPTSR